MIKKLLIVAALLSASISASANEQSYYGVAYSALEVGQFDLGALTFRFGNEFSEYIGIEGRLGIGVVDDTFQSPFGGSFDVKLDYAFGAYLKATTPGDDFRAYALLGFSQLEFDTSTEEEGDTSFGVGFEFGQENNFTLEFLQMIDKDGLEVDSVSIGYLKRF